MESFCFRCLKQFGLALNLMNRPGKSIQLLCAAVCYPASDFHYLSTLGCFRDVTVENPKFSDLDGILRMRKSQFNQDGGSVHICIECAQENDVISGFPLKMTEARNGCVQRFFNKMVILLAINGSISIDLLHLVVSRAFQACKCEIFTQMGDHGRFFYLPHIL